MVNKVGYIGLKFLNLLYINIIDRRIILKRRKYWSYKLNSLSIKIMSTLPII